MYAPAFSVTSGRLPTWPRSANAAPIKGCPRLRAILAPVITPAPPQVSVWIAHPGITATELPLQAAEKQAELQENERGGPGFTGGLFSVNAGFKGVYYKSGKICSVRRAVLAPFHQPRTIISKPR